MQYIKQQQIGLIFIIIAIKITCLFIHYSVFSHFIQHFFFTIYITITLLANNKKFYYSIDNIIIITKLNKLN